MEQQLWDACSAGKVEKVQKLLQNPEINTNWQDFEYSRTSFWIACQKGHIEVVKLLLNDKRVDINKVNKYGVTPFLIACGKGHIDIVKLALCDERVDLNKARDDGVTPFCVACFRGHIKIVKYLLGYGRGIDINQKNNEGKTAIDFAKQRNETDIVELIELFQKNQSEIKLVLRKELGLSGNCTVKENNEWWTWKVDKKWELIETGLTKFKRIQITPNETEYYRKLEYLSIKMGFEIKDFQQIFAIDNGELRKAFSIYRKNALAKQKESPSLFNKNWKEETYSAQRQQFYHYLDDLQNKFNELQSPDQLKVVPAFQGVKKEVVNIICHQGFEARGELDDGYYGKGMYFTSSLDYAMKYSEDKIVILSLLILGNSFPTTEHPFETDKNGNIIYETQNKRGNGKIEQNQNESKASIDGFYGRPLQQGYQSHLTLVDGRDINTAFPIRNQIDSETRDELVAFQSAQVLPLFVLSKQNKLL